MIPNGAHLPIFYRRENIYNAYHQPSTMHASDTWLSHYFQNYLLQKAMSVYKFTLPEEWEKNYFLYTLFCWGFIAVINQKEFGIICQGGTLSGYNVYYQPTKVMITNPLFKEKKDGYIIGEDTEIIPLQPNYGSIMDIIQYYGDWMAITSSNIAVNDTNSKVSRIFFTEDKAQAETFKKMYDRVASGEPAVVVGKRMMNPETGKPSWTMWNDDLSNQWLGDKLLSQLREIERMFDNDIGIPNANTDKRERMIVDEVNQNNVATMCKAALWLESVEKGIENVVAMFPELDGKLKVEWRFAPAKELKGGETNNESDAYDNGAV